MTIRNKHTFILSLALLFAAILPAAYAAPAKDWRKAVFQVTTYTADGQMLRTGNGFYVGPGGEALAAYSLFDGAASAVVIDADGKRLDVSRILGASQDYDLVRLRVATEKNESLTPAAADAAEGDAVLLVPYSTDKKSAPVQLEVGQRSAFNSYAYYTLTSGNEEQYAGCPVLTADGQVVAVAQLNVTDGATGICAIDIEAGTGLHVGTLSYVNRELRRIKIPTAIPDNEADALSYLYMFSMSRTDSAACLLAFDDFIRAYPANGDVFLQRAEFYALHDDYAKAEADIAHVVANFPDKQAAAHYTLSKLVYNKVADASRPAYAPWTVAKALDEAEQAYALDAQPIYRMQVGACQFLTKDFHKAYETFLALSSTPIASSETFYYAARSLEAAGGDSTAILALADSAVARCDSPLTRTGAPFVLARANYRARYGLHREAAQDYTAYEKVIGSRNLNANFYYLREQAELNGRMFQQALDDIDKAISLDAQNALYHLERAVILLRVGSFEEALRSANEARRLTPDNPDGDKLAGIALGELGRTDEALERLAEARAKGSPDADKLIENYQSATR